MSAAREVGVQSFCFRNTKSNTEVAAKVKALGLSKIEVCAVHVDFNDPSTFDEAIAAYREAGVEIVSIGVQTFNAEKEVERQWFEFAKKAGAKYISAHFRVDTFTEAIAVAIELCDEYDIKLALHCHGGYLFGGSKDVIDHILKLGQGRVGLNLDTGWCIQSGRANPVDWAEQFGDLLFGIHYKDFTFNPDGTLNDVVPGTGNLDLPAFVNKAEEKGFGGFAVFEYEGDPDNPVPALKEAIDLLASIPAKG